MYFNPFFTFFFFPVCSLNTFRKKKKIRIVFRDIVFGIYSWFLFFFFFVSVKKISFNGKGLGFFFFLISNPATS